MRKITLALVLLLFTSYIPDRKDDYIIRDKDSFGKEFIKLNSLYWYCTSHETWSVRQKGTFKISRVERDSLFLDAKYKLIIWKTRLD